MLMMFVAEQANTSRRDLLSGLSSEVMRPEPMMRISDPACGTGGFLLAAFEYLKDKVANAKEAGFLRTRALHGIDLVPNVARLCAMNLFLHGIGTDHKHPVISIRDSLESKAEPDEPVIWFLRIRHLGRRAASPSLARAERPRPTRFPTSDRISGLRPATSNSTSSNTSTQCSRNTGRAAVVVPDNVLFEGGAGERFDGHCFNGAMFTPCCGYRPASGIRPA